MAKNGVTLKGAVLVIAIITILSVPSAFIAFGRARLTRLEKRCHQMTNNNKPLKPDRSNEIILVCDTHWIEIVDWEHTDEGLNIRLEVKPKR